MTDYDKNGLANLYNEKFDKKELNLRNDIEKYSILKTIEVEDKDVLDVGCGTGAYCNWFKEYGAKSVTGVDISEDMIKIAKETYPELDFSVASVYDLGEFEGKFDVVCGIYLFDNAETEDQLKLMHVELAKCLKPGGTILFPVPHQQRMHQF